MEFEVWGENCLQTGPALVYAARNLWTGFTNFIWHDGKFFGIDWSVWKVVGWLGNAIFSSRFLVQWYVTEKKKRSWCRRRSGG